MMRLYARYNKIEVIDSDLENTKQDQYVNDLIENKRFERKFFVYE